MLHFIRANDLSRYPDLADSMFRDRADQFKTRLKWNVTIDQRGYEIDQYDNLNPLYVIASGSDGQHQGSMRFLPTTGPTMLHDHFEHLIGERVIESPLIWECTRFCLAPGAPSGVAATLMLAGSELMRQRNIEHFVGVFDARMVRIYQRLGWPPDILGSSGEGRDRISVGLWSRTQNNSTLIARRAEMSPVLFAQWCKKALHQVPVDLYAIA